MHFLIPLGVCATLFLVGYRWPSKTGWVFLIAALLLVDLSNLMVVYDNVLPLRFQQAFFAAALGVACAPSNRTRLLWAFTKEKPLIIIAIFFAMEIAYGLIHPHVILFKYYMLHQYPSYLAALILAFSLIRGERDLERFCKAIAVGALVIAVLAVLENSTGYNVSHHLCAINFSSCNVESQHWAPEALRFGRYEWAPKASLLTRYSGFTGEPNKTAILLAMYMTVFYYPFLARDAGAAHRPLWGAAAFALMLFLAFVLLVSQVRAPIFAFGVVSVAIVLLRPSLKNWAIAGICALVVVLLLSSEARHWVSGFVSTRLSWDNLSAPDQRMRALHKSLALIGGSYGLGVGGTLWSVYDDLLDSDDITAFVLYFVVGGVPLGAAYVTFLAASFLDLARRVPGIASAKHRHLAFLLTCSLAVWLVVETFNEHAIQFYWLLLYAAGKASLLQTDAESVETTHIEPCPKLAS